MPASGLVPETILGLHCSCAWHLSWMARLAGPGSWSSSRGWAPLSLSMAGDHTEQWHMITFVERYRISPLVPGTSTTLKLLLL